MTGIETALMIPSIMSGSLIRETPPSARMSAGTRSSAMTATAPASSAIFACSAVTTSMITPPLSISAMPRFTRAVPDSVDVSLLAVTTPFLTLGVVNSTLAGPATPPHYSRRVRHRGMAWFAVIWAPFFVWWLAQYPGEMWIDSFGAWRQIQQGPWDNHHPAPFVALVWLTSLGGRSVATVTLAQSLAVAAALTYLAVTLSRYWRAGRAPLIAAGAMGWLPLIAPFSLVLQKDAWELAAPLVLAAQLIPLAARELQPGPGVWVALVLTALGATLVRWNGAVTVGVGGRRRPAGARARPALARVHGARRGRRRRSRDPSHHPARLRGAAGALE